MVFACHRCIVATTALSFLFCLPNGIIASSVPTTASTGPILNVPNTTGTCEFRTINYITDILPQQCLRSSWSNTDSPPTTKTNAIGAAGTLESQEIDVVTDTISNAPFSESVAQTNDETKITDETSRTSVIQLKSSSPSPGIPSPTASPTTVDEGELNDASFLSFEEWKKQTLEQAGQQDLNLGKRRSAEAARKRESEAFQNNLESLGDDGEIDLDFGAFRNGGAEQTSRTTKDKGVGSNQDSQEEKSGSGHRKEHRSKDAGKTCKERFSYASFDAGATVLKTHQGAKNSKAVLIENKDSYMLSECKTQNKFLVIELSVGVVLPRSRNHITNKSLGRYMDRHSSSCEL